MKVTKNNLEKNKYITWDIEVIERTEDYLLGEGLFVAPDDYDELNLDPEIYAMTGDRMIEKYFNEQWFNIFEIYRGNSEDLKYWYINISRPAKIEADSVYWEDLVVDLQVFPDGRMVILDMEDFEKMKWEAQEKEKILQTLAFLIKLFKENRPSL